MNGDAAAMNGDAAAKNGDVGGYFGTTRVMTRTGAGPM